jgi:hypothetical protein
MEPTMHVGTEWLFSMPERGPTFADEDKGFLREESIS